MGESWTLGVVCGKLVMGAMAGCEENEAALICWRGTAVTTGTVATAVDADEEGAGALDDTAADAEASGREGLRLASEILRRFGGSAG